MREPRSSGFFTKPRCPPPATMEPRRSLHKPLAALPLCQPPRAILARELGTSPDAARRVPELFREGQYLLARSPGLPVATTPSAGIYSRVPGRDEIVRAWVVKKKRREKKRTRGREKKSNGGGCRNGEEGEKKKEERSRSAENERGSSPRVRERKQKQKGENEGKKYMKIEEENFRSSSTYTEAKPPTRFFILKMFKASLTIKKKMKFTDP